MRREVAILLALVAIVAGACQEEATQKDTPQRLSSTAELQILSPRQGDVIEGDSFVVKVQLAGAEILAEATTQIRPNEGHIHLSFDGKLINLLGGLEETVDDALLKKEGIEEGLTDGKHSIEVEFAAGDHGPFFPRVVALVRFEVKRPAA